jgi:ABC-2 type transport system permease protein
MDEGGFNPLSMQMTARPRRNPERLVDDEVRHIAARVTSDKEGDKLNVIYVADIDMISDVFFELRSRAVLDVQFDNVPFVLNAVDMLAGDETYIELRSRRAKQRTLTRLEERNREFLEQANIAEQEADEAAEKELERRSKQLTGRADEIKADESLDPIAKMQLLQQAQDAEQQQLDLAKAQIEQEKNDKVRKIQAQTERQRQAMQAWFRAGAVWLPPIPAICVGLIVFFRRWNAEKRSVAGSPRSRSAA